MQFGIYAPIPMATVGSPEAAQAAAEACAPLPQGRVDAQFEHSLTLLQTADEVGFDLVLFVWSTFVACDQIWEFVPASAEFRCRITCSAIASFVPAPCCTMLQL